MTQRQRRAGTQHKVLPEHLSTGGSGSQCAAGTWSYPTCEVPMLVRDGGMQILAYLACCTPERSGPQEPENDFTQVLAAAGRLAWVEMVRTEGRQAGMGQALAAAASLSMFPNRNLSIKPRAALPRALEVCSKSTSRFQTGHIEHPHASGFADMVQPWHSVFSFFPQDFRTQLKILPEEGFSLTIQLRGCLCLLFHFLRSCFLWRVYPKCVQLFFY